MGVFPSLRGAIVWALLVGGEVIAGAERRARASDDGDADVVVVLDGVKRLFKLMQQLRVERVAALRSIQRDERDAIVAHFIQKGLKIGHANFPSPGMNMAATHSRPSSIRHCGARTGAQSGTGEGDCAVGVVDGEDEFGEDVHADDGDKSATRSRWNGKQWHLFQNI